MEVASSSSLSAFILHVLAYCYSAVAFHCGLLVTLIIFDSLLTGSENFSLKKGLAHLYLEVISKNDLLYFESLCMTC